MANPAHIADHVRGKERGSGSQPDAAMIASAGPGGRDQYPFVAMNKKRVHSDTLRSRAAAANRAAQTGPHPFAGTPSRRAVKRVGH